MSDKARTLSVGGVQFSYREKGSGPALVLLHGVGSGSRSWTQQLDGLASSFRVIAWDAPGYAGSTALDETSPGAQHYTARLELLLRALEVDKLHLVGHSLGAIVAAKFAAEHPDRLLSLTLASPSGGHARLPESERIKLRDGRLEDLATLGPRGMAEKRGPRLLGPQAGEAHVRSVVETMSQIDPAGYAQAVRLLTVSDTAADLATLPASMPVQFIYGDADVITPPASILKIAAVRPQAPVHAVPGGGHAVYVEKAAAFNRLLEALARSG